MENTLLPFTLDSNPSEINSLKMVCDVRPNYSTDTTLRLDTPRLPNSYFLRPCGSKRKCGFDDGLIGLSDGSSLDLGLGHSSLSFANIGHSAIMDATISSEKETESLSSMKHLNLNLQLGKEMPRNPRKSSSAATPMSLGIQKLKLDLDLNLSAGPAESDVTSVSPGSCMTLCSPSFQNNVEPVMAGRVQLLDEGSTSSRWSKPQVPPRQTSEKTEAVITFNSALVHSKPTVDASNLSPAMISGPKSSATSASGITNQQQQRSNNLKACQVMGCGKGARGASGRCIAHGGGRRCQKSGCHKGAEGKTVFCKAHGGGRRCQHLGCTKSAEGRTDYCIAHGGGRRCSHKGCSRAARGKSGLCIRHGGGKRCKVENCTRSAEGISGLCISHGGGRRCQHPACSKGAQGSTMFCKAHGGGKRCTAPGCTKGAEGSTPFCKGHGGGKRCTFQGGGICPRSVHGGTLYCVAHGGGKRCAMPDCTKSARGRTAYCVRHGGGKRCKYEGCSKSAQGSTDFCKAHGGGKRCSWGQVGGQDAGLCDKFARGKTGLCAAHSAQIQEKQIYCSGTPTPSQNPKSRLSKKIKAPVGVESSYADGGTALVSGRNVVDLNKIGLRDHVHQVISVQLASMDSVVDEKGVPIQFSLPEGRVHGGSLMAMLRSGAVIGPSIDGSAEQGQSCGRPCSWL